MKKILLGALVLMAFPLFQSCIDDSESPSVTQVRNEKAAQLKSLAALYDAQAKAEATIAAAEAAYKNALAAKTNAEAANAAAELASIKARVDYEIENYKAELLKAQLEYFKAEADAQNAQYQHLLTNYTTAANQLAIVQNNLITAKTNLSNYMSGVVPTEQLIANDVASLQKNLDATNQQMALLKAISAIYEEAEGMDPTELAAATAAAKNTMLEKGYAYQVARNNQVSYQDDVNDAKNALYNSDFTTGIVAFTNSSQYIANDWVSGSAFDGEWHYAPGVQMMSNFMSSTSNGGYVYYDNIQNKWFYDVPATTFDSKYEGYYGFMMATPQYDGTYDKDQGNVYDGTYTFQFVPMFSFETASYENETLESETEGVASAQYVDYTEWITYLPEGFTAYLNYLKANSSTADADAVADLEEAYNDAVTAQTTAQTAVDNAQTALEPVEEDWNAYLTKKKELWDAYQEASNATPGSELQKLQQAVADAQTELDDATVYQEAAQAKVDKYEEAIEAATEAKNTDLVEQLKELLTYAETQLEYAEARVTAAEKDLEAAEEALEAYEEEEDNNAAQNAFDLWWDFTGGNNNEADNAVKYEYGQALGAYEAALNEYKAAVQATNRAYQAWQTALNGLSASKYDELAEINDAISAAAADIDGLMTDLNDASLANAKEQLVVNEAEYAWKEATAVYDGYNNAGSIATGNYPSAWPGYIYVNSYIPNVNGISVNTAADIAPALELCQDNITYLNNQISYVENDKYYNTQDKIAYYQDQVDTLTEAVASWKEIVAAAQKALQDYIAENGGSDDNGGATTPETPDNTEEQ